MQFLSGGKGTGKTIRMIEWWLQDPEGRAIWCASAAMAKVTQDAVIRYVLAHPEHPVGQALGFLMIREIARRNIISASTALKGQWGYPRTRQVGIDNLSTFFRAAFGVDVEFVTEQDPAVEALGDWQREDPV